MSLGTTGKRIRRIDPHKLPRHLNEAVGSLDQADLRQTAERVAKQIEASQAATDQFAICVVLATNIAFGMAWLSYAPTLFDPSRVLHRSDRIFIIVGLYLLVGGWLGFDYFRLRKRTDTAQIVADAIPLATSLEMPLVPDAEKAKTWRVIARMIRWVRKDAEQFSERAASRLELQIGILLLAGAFYVWFLAERAIH